MKEAKAVKTEKRERGEGRIWQMGRIWWVQYYDASGRQRRESSRSTTKNVAKKLLRRRLGEKEAGTLPSHQAHGLTYEDLRDAYYAEYVEKKRKSLRFDKAGKPRIDAVVRLDGFFAGYRVLAVTSDAVHEFVAKLKQQGLANQTVKHSLNALKHMFAIALREKKVRAGAAPYFPALDVSKGVRKGFLSFEQFLKLRSELPEHMRCPFTLAYDSGMRRGEIFGLRWTNVDLAAREIRLEETKNGEKRTVPVGQGLFDMLEIERAKHPKAEFVFMRPTRKGPKRVLSFAKAWASACERAGVSGTLFHDLRRCGVRNMVRAGTPQVVAMAISGHKTESTFRRYNIVDGADLKRAASQLDAYQEKQNAELELEKSAADGASSGQIADSPKPKPPSIS